MERTAKCLCGTLEVVVSGEPHFVNACHFTDCQRRSGAPMTSNAYFPSSKVRLEAASRIYRRISAAGRWIDHKFCPDCGTTVCWTLEALPDDHGVPVGLFNDPKFLHQQFRSGRRVSTTGFPMSKGRSTSPGEACLT